MRLTSVLCRQNYYRTIQRVWRYQGKMPIAPLEIPPEIKALNVKIYNALDVAKGIEDCTNEKEEIEVSASNTKKYYLFDKTVKLTGGEEQILALTKTLAYQGLSPAVSSLLGLETLPDQDTLVQDCIMGAIARDAHQFKLPKDIDVKNPGKFFPRKYGARYKRKSCNLMQKLALLASMGSGKFSNSLLRSRNIDAYTELAVDRAGKSVIYQIHADILLSSQRPLEPVANPEEVESTKDIDVPSTYPVLPTLDLHQLDMNPLMQSEYDVSACEIRKKCHVHTLHVVQQSFGFWNPVQKLSRAIATSFAFAAEQARATYGLDVQVLPKPVTVQCIYSDINIMGFLIYQLNTLDFQDDAGVKNQVWVDDPQDLYSEAHEMNGVKDYNSEVFPKMLAFYLNGVHPVSL